MIRLLLPLIGVATLLGCDQSNSAPTSGGDIAGCATRAYDTIGGPIELTDHTGSIITDDALKGQETLVFFGFTYCPDICPTELLKIGAAIDLLPEGVEAPRTALITIDPERDTPEAMAQYISSNGFPDDIVGLTGSPESIKSAADAFKAGYKRVEQPDSAAGYTMDHTSILYLMDKDWKLKTFFTGSSNAQDMANCIAQLSE